MKSVLHKRLLYISSALVLVSLLALAGAQGARRRLQHYHADHPNDHARPGHLGGADPLGL